MSMTYFCNLRTVRTVRIEPGTCEDLVSCCCRVRAGQEYVGRAFHPLRPNHIFQNSPWLAVSPLWVGARLHLRTLQSALSGSGKSLIKHATHVLHVIVMTLSETHIN